MTKSINEMNVPDVPSLSGIFAVLALFYVIFYGKIIFIFIIHNLKVKIKYRETSDFSQLENYLILFIWFINAGQDVYYII